MSNSNKIPLAKGNQFAIDSFVNDIRSRTDELLPIMKELFDIFIGGKLGDKVKSTTNNLFDEWLLRSLLPRISETKAMIADMFSKESEINKIKERIEKKLPLDKFDRDSVDAMVEAIASDKAKGATLEDSIQKNIWLAFAKFRDSFLVQSTHLLIGRILMYFVSLDKKALKSVAMPSTRNPYVKFYWDLRYSLRDYLPSLYALCELDWLYVPDTIREALGAKSRRILESVEDQLDKALAHTYNSLSGYDYVSVDRDLWKEVYEGYLPKEEISRLAFIPTPDEIVETILDLAGYKANAADICKAKILDPACGSGTFLVEACIRLKQHLLKEMACHKDLLSNVPWERQKNILDRILSLIHGIDINPFATFLTTVNLTFQIIEIYSKVREKYEDYNMKLKVVTHDALVEPFATHETGTYENARAKEAAHRTKEYAEILDIKFGYVVGNPPWGAVLRGKIGPLGDAQTRDDYKKRFRGATGKYDIYVLFIERGLKWLREQGIFGMITQITYVSQGFGKGIKNVIKDSGSILYFVDISKFGKLLFPRQTNYPAITVIKRAKSKDKPTIIEVDESD